MQLDFLQIQAITLGAARVEQHEDGVHFYRFTQEQERLYQARSEDFYLKTFSTSGIRLRFRTDSRKLRICVTVQPGCSRSYFSFDIFVDGKMVDNLDNFTGMQLPHDYTKMEFPLGAFEKTVALGEGEKEVCIYLPWSVKVALQTLSLDEGAFITPVKPAKKMLCFGDSITHGYDALRPGNKYITKLADALDAEEYNKAIAAEIFFPGLADTKEDFEPDLITVAYGTNDWNTCSQEEFIDNCKAFYRNLTARYPHTPIWAITPIWRKEMEEERPFGAFRDVDALIRRQVAEFSNVKVVDGFDFVPQEEQYYADLRLHPNDAGFRFYFEGLIRRMHKINVRAAIFDMDGTLIDSLMVWNVLWGKMGAIYLNDSGFRPREEDDKQVRTLPLKEAMEFIHRQYNLGENGSELLELANRLIYDFYANQVQLKPDVRTFLAYCKEQGVKMCIASATAPELLAVAMEHCGLKDYFLQVFSCGDLGKGKDEPDIFLQAAAFLGYPLDETWVFEDSLVAIETATRIGMPTVAIYDPYNYGQEKMKQIATEYIDQGETLLKLV